MTYGRPDVYYDPEKCGVTLVVMLDRPDLSYEFDMLGVWRDDATGRLGWASDSGCSCPSPFEDYNSFGDLTLLGDSPDALRALEDEAWSTLLSYSESRNDAPPSKARSVKEFMGEVTAALKNRSKA